MKLLIVMSLMFLGGCAGMGMSPFGGSQMSPSQAVGAGVVGGAVVSKAADKVREVFTPKYPLHLPPQEICDISGKIVVVCHLVPCKENCEKSYSILEWFENNKKVLTVKMSALPAAIEFCNKNEGACEFYLGEYSGDSIVILEK